MKSRKAFLLQDPQVVIQPDKYNDKYKLSVICITCHKELTITLATYWRQRRNSAFICYECRKPELKAKAQANPLYKDEAYREQFRKLHANKKYALAVHGDKAKRKISDSTKKAWLDPEKRANHLAHRKTSEFKERVSRWAKSQWQDSEYREKQIELRNSLDFKIAASLRTKALWQDPIYRKILTDILDKARINPAPKTHISCLQRILYAVLSDMKLVYHEEGPATRVGPIITSNNRFEGYSFDCLVEYQGRKIYIECQGEYWHKGREARDNAKATFLTRYFPGSELLVIWEHEYHSQSRIRSIIEERLGVKCDIVDFTFSQVTIDSNPQLDELKSLFSKYHYLANIGRVGSKRFSAVVGDKLAAGAVFSSPTRIESAKRLGLSNGELLELSRFCIAPQFCKKNFASWFLSRTTNIIWKQYHNVKKILSFADTTQGHVGTIYRASNWDFDGIVRPDYWYLGQKGEWYHKKSVWDLASKDSVTEKEFADSRNLVRVMGKEKLRFVLCRP